MKRRVAPLQQPEIIYVCKFRPKRAWNYAALPQQKEVMTIFMFLRYEIKTKFCLIYPIFNKKFKIFDA